jgi:spore coat polysaccharide biosynthesis predicted glycosyltransferase SpsG
MITLLMTESVIVGLPHKVLYFASDQEEKATVLAYHTTIHG